MRLKFTMLLFSLTFSASLLADNSYSIFLVRHAEKKTQGDNPSLTACGKTRANQLASLLSQIGIQKVYSSPYQRTSQTAAPVAKSQNVAIQIYNPKHLAQLALLLQKRKENALVVGHSNTTPQLVELLSKQAVKPIAEENFQHLYQIQFIAGQTMVTVLTQPLRCHG